MRLAALLLFVGFGFVCAGCEKAAQEGKVTITNPDAFKKMKGVKPMPTRVPPP